MKQQPQVHLVNIPPSSPSLQIKKDGPMRKKDGGDDGFVTKKSLRDSYDAVSSKDKSIAIFGKAQGYLTNYGHCDLILGKDSEKEVYPVLLNWLDERTHLPEIRQ